MIPCASLTVQEPSTGVEFPLVQKFWWAGDGGREQAPVVFKHL